jgi:preprotein translocase subunit SecB
MSSDLPKALDKETKGFSGAAYNHVAMGSKLKLISLACSHFDVKSECLSERKNWKLNYELSTVACNFDADNSSVTAIFAFEVSAKLGRKTAMKCTAEYAVVYGVPDDSEEEAAEGFCHNVGRYAAYPYFRALVAQFAANANLVLPPLPAIASTAHIPKKVSGVTLENKADEE